MVYSLMSLISKLLYTGIWVTGTGTFLLSCMTILLVRQVVEPANQTAWNNADPRQTNYSQTNQMGVQKIMLSVKHQQLGSHHLHTELSILSSQSDEGPAGQSLRNDEHLDNGGECKCNYCFTILTADKLAAHLVEEHGTDLATYRGTFGHRKYQRQVCLNRLHVFPALKLSFFSRVTCSVAEPVRFRSAPVSGYGSG